MEVSEARRFFATEIDDRTPGYAPRLDKAKEYGNFLLDKINELNTMITNATDSQILREIAQAILDKFDMQIEPGKEPSHPGAEFHVIFKCKGMGISYTLGWDGLAKYLYEAWKVLHPDDYKEYLNNRAKPRVSNEVR